MTDVLAFVPVVWIRLDRYCELTGEPIATVRDRCRQGEWREGYHWRTRGRRMWVHLPRAQEWVENDAEELVQAWK